MGNNNLESFSIPLKVDEVLGFLKHKWGVSYEMRILIREKKIFLQIMWGYLEQQSFPEDAETFRNHLGQVLDVINRSGQSSFVRHWLLQVKERPKVGKALSLRLRMDERIQEFVI